MFQNVRQGILVVFFPFEDADCCLVAVSSSVEEVPLRTLPLLAVVPDTCLLLDREALQGDPEALEPYQRVVQRSLLLYDHREWAALHASVQPLLGLLITGEAAVYCLRNRLFRSVKVFRTRRSSRGISHGLEIP